MSFDFCVGFQFFLDRIFFCNTFSILDILFNYYAWFISLSAVKLLLSLINILMNSWFKRLNTPPIAGIYLICIQLCKHYWLAQQHRKLKCGKVFGHQLFLYHLIKRICIFISHKASFQHTTSRWLLCCQQFLHNPINSAFVHHDLLHILQA